MEKRESNYEIMKHQMQAQFASNDMMHIADEWGLEHDHEFLLVSFAGRACKIDCASGAILYEEEGALKEADYNVSMTLFDILTRKFQKSAGTYRASGSFSTVHLASSGKSSGGFFQSTAKFFDQKEDLLASVCEKMGGTPYGKGDVGYRIPIFQDLCVLVQFYSSDEDFEAELSFFCDDNILKFMHFETMMFMLSHVAERLRQLA